MRDASHTPPLVHRAQHGDERAFTELFRQLQPALLRYLRARFGGAAEDVAAETWAAVARDLHRFSGSDDDFRGWVFSIARARGIDEVRRAAKRPLPVDATASVEVATGSAETAALERLAEMNLLELVRRLPPDQRDAVAARVLAGLDVSMAARLLGKSPAAVRVNAHRGLHRLATLLDPSRRDVVA